MSAAEIDALKEIHDTERKAEEMILAAEREAKRIIAESKLAASKRFNEVEATLRQEAAHSAEKSVAESKTEIAKLMNECEADIARLNRIAYERRENAIQRLTVLVLQWQ